MAQNDIERYLWGIAPAMSLEEFVKAIAAYKDKAVEEARARVFDELTAPTERGYEPTENIVVQRVYDMKLGQLKGEK